MKPTKKAPKQAQPANPKPTKAKPTKAKKAQQLKLPAEGMARKSNPRLDTAAEAYRAVRNSRQELSKEEKARKAELLAVAREEGIDVYVYESEDGEEFEVRYTAKQDEDVKVRKLKPDDEDEE